MENVTEALYMAFGVLIFVLALSISIYSFGSVRRTTDTVMELRDRENDYTYIDSGATTRTVGVETIVPMLYRAFKENYIIIFEGLDNEPLISQYMIIKKDSIGNPEYKWVDTNVIDLTTITTGSQQSAKTFIDCLLGTSGAFNAYNSKLVKIKNNNLYYQLKGHTFTEKMGVVYAEDINKIKYNNSDIRTLDSVSEEGLYDSNKTERRIITYTKEH